MAKKKQDSDTKRKRKKELDPHTKQHLENLGKRIKSLRKEAGYTNYEKFAFTHDIDRSQYGKYETGGDLRFSSLLKVLKGLDISLAEFFSEGFEEGD